jgi:hypothetical protein
MSATTQNPSQHLASARALLVDLESVVGAPDSDAQVKATVAVAQSVLVLAEQVAALRVLGGADVAALGTNGQAAAPQPS